MHGSNELIHAISPPPPLNCLSSLKYRKMFTRILPRQMFWHHILCIWLFNHHKLQKRPQFGICVMVSVCALRLYGHRNGHSDSIRVPNWILICDLLGFEQFKIAWTFKLARLKNMEIIKICDSTAVWHEHNFYWFIVSTGTSPISNTGTTFL